MKKLKNLMLIPILIVSILLGFDVSVVEVKATIPEVKITKVDDVTAKKVLKQVKKNKKFILKIKASNKTNATKTIRQLNSKISNIGIYETPLNIPTASYYVSESSKGYYQVTITKDNCRLYNLRVSYIEKVYKNIIKNYNNLKNDDYKWWYEEKYNEYYKTCFDYYNSNFAEEYKDYEYVYINKDGEPRSTYSISRQSEPMSHEEMSENGWRLLEKTPEEYADRLAKKNAESYQENAIQSREEDVKILKAKGIEEPFKKWSNNLKIEIFTVDYHHQLGRNPYMKADYDTTYKTKGNLYYSSDYIILSKMIKQKQLEGVCTDLARVQQVICNALGVKNYIVSNDEDNHAVLLMRGEKGSTGRYAYYQGSNTYTESIDDYIENRKQSERTLPECMRPYWQKDVESAMGKDYPKNGCLSGEYNYYFKNGKVVYSK